MQEKTPDSVTSKTGLGAQEHPRKASHFKQTTSVKNSLLGRTKSRLAAFFEHPIYIVFSSIIAIYSLFSDDLRQVSADKTTDTVFYAVTLAIFCIFAVELIISSFVVDDYFLGFYFWLDVISTVSMLLDIGWISSLIFQTSVVAGNAGRQGLKLARAARVSKLGSRAGRMLRILRLVRLIRIAKIYKITDKIQLKEKAQKFIKQRAERRKSSVRVGSQDANIRIIDHLDFAGFYKSSPPKPTTQLEDLLYNQRSVSNLIDYSNFKAIPEKRAIEAKLNHSFNDFKTNPPSNGLIVPSKMQSRHESVKVISIAENMEKPKTSFTKQVPLKIDPQNPGQRESAVNFNSENNASTISDRLAMVHSGKLAERERKRKSKLVAKRSQTALNGARRNDSRAKKQSILRTSFGEIVEERYYEDELEMSAMDLKSDSKHLAPHSKEMDRVETESVDKETNIGKKLADLVHKRVVIIVLLIMLMIPIFSTDTYFTRYTNYEFGLMQIYNSLDQQTVLTPETLATWKYFVETLRFEPENLLNLQVVKYLSESDADVILNYGDAASIEKFRDAELLSYTFPDDLQPGSIAVTMLLETSYYEDCNAYFSICRTVVICFILAFAAFFFSKDVTNLVLTPLENMMRIINNIKSNPLNAIKMEEENAFMWGKVAHEDGEAAREREAMEGYETTVLEKIVIKIGSLLAIGFGEAGSQIIIQNIRQTGAINPLIPGKRVQGIFGFCDIRCFTDITEILQEEIMVFVNKIGEVVHSTVDKYAGTANKNIGDAFLLVWKFPEEEQRSASEAQVGPDFDHIRSCLADMSIISFVKILIEIQKSARMDAYNHNPRLTSRIPDFRVRMGFGLSQGWAIEGAIGSEYKIDASYLSPHVNMASRLEGATKQYGVPLLIADSLRDLCSDYLKRLLRQVDAVFVADEADQARLYTFDAEYSNLAVDPDAVPVSLKGIEKKREKYINRSKKRTFHHRLFTAKLATESLIARSKDFKAIRKGYNSSFFELWERAFAGYQAGDWEQARQLLVITRGLIKNAADGPSDALLKFMDECKGKPPQNWNGFRKFN